MKTLLLTICLLALFLSLGCGSGPGIHGISGGTGNFSNASLSGSYVYQIRGIDFSSGTNVVYYEAGVFTADGSGHITTGIDDVTESNTAELGNTTSGTYAIASNGTGSISLNGAGFGSITLAVTLVSNSEAYLVEQDDLNASGVAELQSTSSAISSAPTGTYVFKMHNTSANGSTSFVGQFTVSGGIFQSGNVDVNTAGTASIPTLANFTLNAPIASGRGTGSFTAGTTVSSFIYYIVDGNNLRFISTDTSSNVGGYGRAEMQTGSPFSTASLSGNYVFSSKGDDSTGIGEVDTVGLITASGGSITGGSYDAVQDGTTLTDVAITGGTYAVASNGRATVSWNSASKDDTQVFWLVSSSRAFFLTDTDSSDPTDVEDGIASLQQSSSFSNSSINGQFALVMDGYSTTAGVFIDRTGTLQWNGAGALTLNEFVNDSGSGNTPGALSGTYTVGANGRATGTINSLSNANNDLIVYFISSTDGYILQEDQGYQLIGEIIQQ